LQNVVLIVIGRCSVAQALYRPRGLTMKVQLLLVTATALAVTTAAASTHTRHHHKHHARGPNVAQPQADPRVVEAMKTLKAMSAKLGPPRLEGNARLVARTLPVCISAKLK